MIIILFTFLVRFQLNILILYINNKWGQTDLVNYSLQMVGFLLDRGLCFVHFEIYCRGINYLPAWRAKLDYYKFEILWPFKEL